MSTNVTLAALEMEAERCEAALAQLSSHEAIERLQRTYGYFTDKGLWDEAADLFAEDASWEYAMSGVYIGRDRIRAALGLRGPQGLETGELNNHWIVQPIISIADDNTSAKARWRSNMQIQKGDTSLWGDGIYENSYVNEDGVWKIASLHFYVTMWCDYETGWVEGNVAMEPASTKLPPDRPSTEVYESLPGVHLPPYHYPNPVTGKAPEPGPQDIALDADAPAEIAGLVETLSTVAKRVERVRDLRAVEKLQRSYGYYVDKAMWQDVSDLFHEGSVLEIGGKGMFLGKARVLEYMGIGLGPSGPQQSQIISHEQFQGIVTISEDGTSARGRWRAFVIGGSPWAAVNWGDVTYENRYVKKDGVWTIDVLRAPFTMYTHYKNGWHKETTPNTRPETFPPPPDLPPSVIYLTYPNFYVAPFHYPNPVTGKEAPPPNRAAGGLAPMTDYIDDNDG